MTAFEIYLNGRKVCTAGLNGAGVVMPTITWFLGEGPRRKRSEELAFHVSGLVSRTRTHLTWAHRPLKIGDEVRIVVAKKSKVDAPKKKRRESKAHRLKRERDYIEKKIAEYGWTVTK
jgi:hypothetical protein